MTLTVSYLPLPPLLAYVLALLIILGCVRPNDAAFVEPYWNSTKYDAGFYGGYPYESYASFDYISPHLNILRWEKECEDGLITMTPRGPSVPELGPLLMDPRGNLVWMDPKYKESHNFQIQKYKGENFLTFWSGVNNGTHGRGYSYMLDQHYQVRYVLQPEGHLTSDLHEFRITADGTALITMYETIAADLSEFGISSQGWIVDSLFQEVDVETGKKLFEWRASDHYNISDTYAPLLGAGKSPSNGFDYFHINSIDKDPEGNYYISSRYMCTITCISGKDGSTLWRLGGRNSSFRDLSDGAASNMTWQHHMSYYPKTDTSDAYITIFDNGAYNHVSSDAYQSRGLSIHLDTRPSKMTAKVLHTYVAPVHIISQSQGSMQVLPSRRKSSEHGNVFIGWGHSGSYTEFKSNGDVACHVHFGPFSLNYFGWAKSYRMYRYFDDWIGRPKTRPSIGMLPGDTSKVFVSWNGATEVKKWRLQGAKENLGSGDSLKRNGWSDINTLPKEGFEVAFDLEDGGDDHGHGHRSVLQKRHGEHGDSLAYLRALAIGSDDEVLGITLTLERHSGYVHPVKSKKLDEAYMAPFAFVILVCLACFGAVLWWEFRRGRRLGRVRLPG